jgi:hypothetical protein
MSPELPEMEEIMSIPSETMTLSELATSPGGGVGRIALMGTPHPQMYEITKIGEKVRGISGAVGRRYVDVTDPAGRNSCFLYFDNDLVTVMRTEDHDTGSEPAPSS